MKGIMKVTALLLGLTVGTALADGSIAQGDFSVYKGGQLAEKLSGQNPVENGSLLVCDGKCMIKSPGIALVAADQAKLAIKNKPDAFNLILREGTVDFVITDKARKIVFHTPEGIYSVAETFFNAGDSPVVRGSIMVNSKGQSEISVTEGKMVFITAAGKQTVDANSKLVLAQSLGGPSALGGMSSGTVAAGAAVGVASVGLIDNATKSSSSDAGDSSGDGGTTPPDETPPSTDPTPSPPPPVSRSY